MAVAKTKGTRVLKVKAIDRCYIGHKLREVGDIFQVKMELFHPNCMVILAGELSAEIFSKLKEKEHSDESLKVQSLKLEDEFEDEAEPEEIAGMDESKVPESSQATVI